MLILDDSSILHVSRDPCRRTSYAARVRASRVSSCQSSCENMVLRASSTRDSREGSSGDRRQGTDRPTSLPSFSYVTTRPSDTPPRRPRSSSMDPSSLLRMGAKPLLLNSGAAVLVSRRTPSASAVVSYLLRTRSEHPVYGAPEALYTWTSRPS